MAGEIDNSELAFDTIDENEEYIDENIPYGDERPDYQDRVRCRTPSIQSIYLSKLKSKDCPLYSRTKRALERLVVTWCSQDTMMANSEPIKFGGKFGGMILNPIEIWKLRFQLSANLLIDECSPQDIHTAYYQNFIEGLESDLEFTLSRTHGHDREGIANRRLDSRSESIQKSEMREGPIINIGNKGKKNKILGR